MILDYYLLISAFLASVIAQISKPFIQFARTRTWDWRLLLDSGGFPSSHSALVSALTVGLGMCYGTRSPYFAIACVFSAVICYDAANVRYYAGQNIQITRQLIKDMEIYTNSKLDDPIYSEKLKIVLGHKWTEVFGGVLLGIIISGGLGLWLGL